MCAVFSIRTFLFSTHSIYQTSLLPENDRTSVSLKEYLAGIDVSMGGRVAEELSEFKEFFLGKPF